MSEATKCSRLVLDTISANWAACEKDLLDAGIVLWDDTTCKLDPIDVEEAADIATEHGVCFAIIDA